MFTPAQQMTLVVMGLALVAIVLAGLAARALAILLGGMAMRRAEREGGLPGPWRSLREDVEMSNRVLSRTAFGRIQRLFLDYYASGLRTPGGLTREWEQEEFLLVVDEHGNPLPPNGEMLYRFRKTAEKHPAFRRWFQEAVLEEGEWAGVTTLLTARWLCHLAGLRHATVLVFIDPPAAAGEAHLARDGARTLVQVRSLDRFEAPGALDIACAGHVRGMDAPLAALEKELREELDLGLDDLEDLRLLERYNSFREAPDGRTANHEHRILFRARLKAPEGENVDGLARIHFYDGEVAGMEVMTVEALWQMAEEAPQRMAGGLRDSLGYYSY